MRPNRRRFLSLLGIGAASAPLAAKAVAEAEVSSLIGSYRTGLAVAGGIAPSIGYPSSEGPSSVPVYNYVKAFGVPDFVEELVRQRSKNIYAFDPDIAIKKSWSMAAKIHEQRQRNYKRQLDQHSVNGKYELAQSAFKEITGFSWPW